MPATCVATIGNFDGVHIGHAALVRRAREMAGGGRVVALGFDPHPASVLAPGSEPQRLTTFEERAGLLRAAGADEVVRLEPSAALLGLGPDEFLGGVVERHGVTAIVEGHDFHFGKARAGTPRTLVEFGRTRGIDVVIVPPVEVELCDQTLVRAASSMVRWLLERGRVTDAHRVLGRPFSLRGTVVRNDQRGRTIGFPTANLDPATLGGVMVPGDGVYVGLAALPDGERLPAAVHIGPRPTFNAAASVVETHVIGWGGPPAGGAEYGWTLGVHLLAHLRELVRFDGPSALAAQIGRDRDRALRIASWYLRAGGVAAPVALPEEVRS